MRIWLDTTERGKIIWGQEGTDNTQIFFGRTEQLYPSFERFLRKQKIPLKKLRGLGVVVGPGTFTAVRMAVIFANTLNYTLKIPLYAFKVGNSKDFSSQKIQKQLTPLYLSAPNITRAK